MTETPAERRRRLYERPVARALALAEEWDADERPITRAEASRLLAERLDSRGWEEREQIPLAVVPLDGRAATQLGEAARLARLAGSRKPGMCACGRTPDPGICPIDHGQGLPVGGHCACVHEVPKGDQP